MRAGAQVNVPSAGHRCDAPASLHHGCGDIARPPWFGRVLGAEDADIKPVDFFLFDVTGGVFEYQITESLGPNTTHSKVRCHAMIVRECCHGNCLVMCDWAA